MSGALTCAADESGVGANGVKMHTERDEEHRDPVSDPDPDSIASANFRN